MLTHKDKSIAPLLIICLAVVPLLWVKAALTFGEVVQGVDVSFSLRVISRRLILALGAPHRDSLWRS